MARVLVVDDDAPVQDVIARILRPAGHDARPALNGHAALQCARSLSFDLAIVDLRLPGPDGTETFRLLRREQPRLPGILITGFPDYPSGVVEAMRDGFSDYIAKPFQPAEFLRRVEAALERHRPCAPSASEAAGHVPKDSFEGIVGVTSHMQEVFDLICRVAATDEPVLILGETGTGKELVARAIHRRSRRSVRPLQIFNCASAGPDSLLESELFGHERGAFTGATGRAIGWFESAQNTTLFLDEVGELSPAAQAKLLRAIEQREIYRLGGHQSIHIDVRVIAATNVNLRLAGASFRQDLFHRLSGLEIFVPPLRDRLADLPTLVEHFLPAVASALQRPRPSISQEAMRLLEMHSWPGNVRELQNELKKACLRCSGALITIEHLSKHLRGLTDSPSQRQLSLQPQTVSLRAVGHAAQQARIEDVLLLTRGNVSAAARLLGVSRRTIQRLKGTR